MARLALRPSALFALFLAIAGRGDCQEVVAVLSSELAPYREAFAGFREAVGVPVGRFVLAEGSPQLPRLVRVVVAFGSKAASLPYPDRAAVVLCMAPASPAEEGGGTGRRVRVHMLPEAGRVLAVLRQLQPGLRRLVTLSVLDADGSDAEQMRRVAGAQGIDVRHETLGDADLLPERLRRLAQEDLDALWLPPDPLLINARTFAMLKEFARANGVPLYAPTAGFVEAGATASIAPSFRDIGATAALAARDLLEERPVAVAVFPAHIETTVNRAAARRVGLRVDALHVDRFVGDEE